MRKQYFVVFLVALIVLIAIAFSFGNLLFTRSASVRNIDTGKSYSTIQSAIDDQSTTDGNRILVGSGVCYEHIKIDKSISLIGADKQNTIVDGGGNGTVIQISNSDVEIANFTVRNAGTSQWFGNGFPDSCIDVEGGTNVIVINNIVSNATVGIWSYASTNMSVNKNYVVGIITMGIVVYSGTNNTVTDNFLENCGIVGIHLDGYTVGSSVANNKITNSEEGIDIEKSSENILEGNQLLNNNMSIAFSKSSGNSVQYCTIENSSIGIAFIQSNGNSFSHNSLVNNDNQVVSDFSITGVSDAISGNKWDDSKVGNYWSDYQSKYPYAQEVDSSGTGNIPYTIDQNNTDYYPLLRPNSFTTSLPYS